MKLVLYPLVLTIALLCFYNTNAASIELYSNKKSILKRSVPPAPSLPVIRLRKGLPFKNSEMGIVGLEGASSSELPNN
jgi:hypothetical protein